MKNRQSLILKANGLLLKRFGSPPRNKVLPDPLDLLIATILSQNTNDNNSYRAFQNLKSHYKTWDKLIGVRRTEIERIIRVAGLGKQKSESIKNLLGELHKRGPLSINYLDKMNNGSAIEHLTGFKGVGVKTASCVLLFALGRNVCPVDTHVHRTANRIGVVSETSPDKTFYSLNENLPDGIAHSFHTNLIRLGREICKPAKPQCGACPLVKICGYGEKNLLLNVKQKERSFMLLDNVSPRATFIKNKL